MECEKSVAGIMGRGTWGGGKRGRQTDDAEDDYRGAGWG